MIDQHFSHSCDDCSKIALTEQFNNTKVGWSLWFLLVISWWDEVHYSSFSSRRGKSVVEWSWRSEILLSFHVSCSFVHCISSIFKSSIYSSFFDCWPKKSALVWFILCQLTLSVLMLNILRKKNWVSKCHAKSFHMSTQNRLHIPQIYISSFSISLSNCRQHFVAASAEKGSDSISPNVEERKRNSSAKWQRDAIHQLFVVSSETNNEMFM